MVRAHMKQSKTATHEQDEKGNSEDMESGTPEKQDENPTRRSERRIAKRGKRITLPKKPATDLEEWPCRLDNCTKIFQREADLKRHQRTAKSHALPGNQRDIVCPTCKAFFTRSDALKRHQKTRSHFAPVESDDQDESKSQDNSNDGSASEEEEEMSNKRRRKSRASSATGLKTTIYKKEAKQITPSRAPTPPGETSGLPPPPWLNSEEASTNAPTAVVPYHTQLWRVNAQPSIGASSIQLEMSESLMTKKPLKNSPPNAAFPNTLPFPASPSTYTSTFEVQNTGASPNYLQPPTSDRTAAPQSTPLAPVDYSQVSQLFSGSPPGGSEQSPKLQTTVSSRKQPKTGPRIPSGSKSGPSQPSSSKPRATHGNSMPHIQAPVTAGPGYMPYLQPHVYPTQFVPVTPQEHQFLDPAAYAAAYYAMYPPSQQLSAGQPQAHGIYYAPLHGGQPSHVTNPSTSMNKLYGAAAFTHGGYPIQGMSSPQGESRSPHTPTMQGPIHIPPGVPYPPIFSPSGPSILSPSATTPPQQNETRRSSATQNSPVEDRSVSNRSVASRNSGEGEIQSRNVDPSLLYMNPVGKAPVETSPSPSAAQRTESAARCLPPSLNAEVPPPP